MQFPCIRRNCSCECRKMHCHECFFYREGPGIYLRITRQYMLLVIQSFFQTCALSYPSCISNIDDACRPIHNMYNKYKACFGEAYCVFSSVNHNILCNGWRCWTRNKLRRNKLCLQKFSTETPVTPPNACYFLPRNAFLSLYKLWICVCPFIYLCPSHSWVLSI